MEWLKTLWQKINSPTAFILVGIAFLKFSPKDISWMGYIFLAIGIAEIADFFFKKATKKMAKNRRDFEILMSLYDLNHDEIAILNDHISRGEKTFYVNPYSKPLDLYQHNRDFLTIHGLADKGIVSITQPTDKAAVIHIHDLVFKHIKQQIDLTNQPIPEAPGPQPQAR